MSRRARSTKKVVFLYLFLTLVFGYGFAVYVFGDVLELIENLLEGKLIIYEDISCYREGDVKYKNEAFEKNSIFLITTSCANHLSLQSACSIESVLKTQNRERLIYVLSTQELKDCENSEGMLYDLQQLSYIRFVRIQIDEYVKDTPLEGVFSGNFLATGMRQQKRVLEMLKFATLYKYGGIVIDMNMIVSKQLDFLGENWAIIFNQTCFGSEIIAMNRETPVGKLMLPAILRYLKEQQDLEIIDSGQALTEAFKLLCYTNPAPECNDFRIYEPEYFYPYNRSMESWYFKRGDLSPVAFGYRIWSTRHAHFYKKDSVYMQLLEEYCPHVKSYYHIV